MFPQLPPPPQSQEGYASARLCSKITSVRAGGVEVIYPGVLAFLCIHPPPAAHTCQMVAEVRGRSLCGRNG